LKDAVREDISFVLYGKRLRWIVAASKLVKLPVVLFCYTKQGRDYFLSILGTSKL